MKSSQEEKQTWKLFLPIKIVFLERMDLVIIHEKKAKKFSSFFSKSEPNVMPFISYNYYMKKGHVLKNYYARKYDVPKGFMKCIPKGSRKA